MTNFNIFFLIVSTHRMLFNIFHSLELVFLNYKLVFINRQFTLTARNVDYKEEKKNNLQAKVLQVCFYPAKVKLDNQVTRESFSFFHEEFNENYCLIQQYTTFIRKENLFDVKLPTFSIPSVVTFFFLDVIIMVANRKCFNSLVLPDFSKRPHPTIK